MDRSRKPTHPPFMMSGLIALGKTKGSPTTSAPATPDPETATASKPKSSSGTSKVPSKGSSGSTSSGSGSGHSKGSGDRKREGAPSLGSSLPPKKIKTHGHSSSSVIASGSGTSLASSSASSTTLSSTAATNLEKKSNKADTENFVKQFSTMELTEGKAKKILSKLQEMNDAAAFEAFFLTSLQRLRQLKEKPEMGFCEALFLGMKEHPQYLRSQAAVESMCGLVKVKRTGVDIKPKTGQYHPMMLSVLGVNMLSATHGDISTWPLTFLQLWLDDSCHERYWVDLPECEDFVDTLVSGSFDTIVPEKDLLPPPDGVPAGGSSPALFADLETEFRDELNDCIGHYKSEIENSQRFTGLTKSVETMVVEYAKEIILKRSPELPKNLFRTLGSCCGLQEVRAFIISRIEQWLHNAKCSKQAQELLMFLCVNAKSYRSAGADGGQYIVQICKLRMKTKQLTQLFSLAMREMVRDDSLNLKNVLVQIVYNELSLQRNPTNYPVLGAVLSAFPEARSELAIIFMDLLQKKEEFIVALRQILRDSMRACRHDCNLSDFVFGLLNVRELTWPEGTEMRNRVFRNVVDLVVFSIFLSFTPNVKEASVSRTEKNMGVLTNFYNQIAKVQEEALSWLYSWAMKLYRPQKPDYIAALYKFVLKDAVTDLNYKENWPTESDRSMFARHCLEVPLLESTFMWVLFQGFSKEHNFFTVMEILDVTEMMVMRAAMHGARIEISKPDLVDTLFRLAEYKHPENIALPIGYAPPKLGITKSCWRVWTMLLILASYNPTVIGKKGWEMLPTLRVLMEMCMTNHFTYPTMASTETVEEITSRELQLGAIEKEQILEFESHLAAASTKCTITEKNSILLPQLITLDPYGKPRTPQPWVAPHIKSLNEQLRLGYRFCRSRNPDFLVDLMQGKQEAMPWLSELVTEGSFEILPVRSLCEFMLGQTERLVKLHNTEADGVELVSTNGGDKSPKKGHKGQATAEVSKEDTKSIQLLQYLQNTVQKTSEDNATEMLEFFFRRLSFPKALSRLQGIQALQLLFSTPKKPLDDNWLLETIPNLPLFSDIRSTLTKCLREAIQVENEPLWITRYLEFLSVWGVVESDTILDNLALDVTQLVVERCIVIQALLTNNPEVYDSLFDIYLNYMKKIREPGKDCQQWTGSIEQVLVRWEKAGLEANMNILIVHAIVILLSSFAEISEDQDTGKKPPTFSHRRGASAVTEMRYNELLEMWFPKQAEFAPKGLLLNTVEEAVLFPDWIKLRMIRSNNTRLLAAASEDLDIDQLVLFVQSFGIPIQSMTGLLYCLDKAVEQSPQKMTDAILDPRYMKTIVEVQWKRGAKGGENFFRLLNQLSTTEEEIVDKFQVGKPYNPRPVLQLPKVDPSSGKKTLPSLLLLGTKTLPSCSQPKPRETPMDTSTKEELSVRALTKQLLTLSVPSRRRHNSISILEEPGKSSGLSARRHSVSLEKQPLGSPSTQEIQVATTVGQLVDVIREVEPCIVKNALDVQLQLLFGRCEITPQCRAFLLTVLTHESGWETVEDCLNLFLTEFVSSYDPTAVLDLISSTISNPKLWQGVDKYVPKHQKQVSIFNLTNNQLLVMAEYIVEEISQVEMKTATFSISNLLGKTEGVAPKNGKKIKHCLQERVSLWLRCCRQDKETVDAVMNALSDKKSRNPCARKFLTQIYVEFPQVILTENWKEKSEDLLTSSDESGSCVLDTVSHILINAVANTQSGKDWEKKVAHEYELCLRKIASVHPTLLLRQLPLMGVLLEGRVHLEFQVFHAQNHHVPFRVFLGLFDLMQPHVLRQFNTLKPMLELYMQLIENFGHLKDYGLTVSRCSVLLHNLLLTNPSEMKEFLTRNYSILKELTSQIYYLNVGPLQNLITSVVPPSTHSEISILTQNRKEMDPFSMSSKQSNEIHEKLEHSMNNDEVLTSLAELDSLSQQNPAVLHQFTDYLNCYLVSDLESCRQLAFNLILKHMTYSPGASKLYLKSILQALRAQGGSRSIESFMERMPEFVVLAQENADVILTQMFELALSSSVSMLPTITKSLSLLRNQTGT